MIPILALAAIAAGFSGAASGEVGGELRLFPEEPAFETQPRWAQPSFFFEVELEWASEDRDVRLIVTPFGRFDAEDSTRTHPDLREAYLFVRVDDWDVLVGLNRVFWGVTESRHLVNVINQIDFVENLDEEDFLGQPMVNVGTQQAFGRFDLFVMTGFRLRTWPGRQGRLRPPLPIDNDRATFDTDLERWAVDVGFRYSHYVGDLDFGVSLFRGTGREPLLVPTAEGTLRPEYSTVYQAGLDAQWTVGATLLKLEAIIREGQGHTFAAVVGGVEHTLFQLFGGRGDLGLLVEGLYDGRSETEAPFTFFDDDVFMGARYAFNDVQDTSAPGGRILGFERRQHDPSSRNRAAAPRRRSSRARSAGVRVCRRWQHRAGLRAG